MVRANLACLGRGGFSLYNVGTGTETNVVELFEQLRQAVGSELAAVHGPAKPGEQRRSSVDPRRLQSELGVGPPRDLTSGLRRTVAWFRNRP